ncbi:hypothetical protein L0Y65_01305 [Candidatus Micrarchaeota archaeon]|nr:hypothetical protein [Candidatus Micrarchaeota archaeon]
MKKVLLFIGLLAIVSGVSFAYNQTEVCESQCQAWKFVWQDDFAFDYVKTMCAKDPTDVGLEMVGFWADIVEKGLPLQNFMEAYLCYDVVTTYLHPQIDACKATCRADNLSYAPNLYLDDYSVYYDDDEGEILIRIRNNGRAYMPGAFVAVYAGDSANTSKPTNFKMIKNATVGGTRPSSVRYLPEGYETAERTLTVPYTPKPDRYNVVQVVVTPEDIRYLEMGMRDNVYELTINDLPQPARLWIESANFTRFEDTTDTFIVSALVTNEGELPADAEVRYYLGSPHKNDLAASENVRVLAGGEVESEQPVIFQPGSSTYITVQLVSNGTVIMDRTLYPNPIFYYVEGKVMDEEGRAIPGAAVKVGSFTQSDFPLTSGQDIITMADETGHYDFYAPFTKEQAIRIHARKNGYFTNSTPINLEYVDDDETFSVWQVKRTIRADIILTQHPLEVGVDYPAPGRYIIETDKGRYTGNYTPGVPVPVRGENGTIFIASKNCSFFSGKFNSTYQDGYLEYRPNVTCLAPDANDDYILLSKEALLWDKQYSGEEPRLAVFDKRGDHVYVLTSDTETNFCNVYGYDLVSGSEQFRFETNSNCIQRSKISPAYDGSQVYIGMNAVRYASSGDKRARGHILAEDGDELYSWDFPEHAETLLYSSAGTMAELVYGVGKFYAPGNLTLKDCNLVHDRPCDSGGKAATIDALGLSGNRVIGSCNSTACIFTPAYDGAVMLDRHYTNPTGSGNYANDDLFIADYKGGAYFHEADEVWGTGRKTDYVSMSPGGSYVVLAYDPYAIEVFSPTGESLMNSTSSCSGIEATERGIFFASHKGAKLSIFRMSTMVEPGSSTTTGGGTLHTDFVSWVWDAIVSFYNALAQAISSMFG